MMPRQTLLTTLITENAMATQPRDNPQTDVDDKGQPRRKAAIGRHVLHGLGQPDALLRVDVRHLWEDHYRVNVVVGRDAASARIAHSYFLVADGAGNVLAATPKLTRRY
jgi:hypothetical protein